MGGYFFLRISHKVPRESFFLCFFDIDNVQCSICICSRNVLLFFLKGVLKGVLLGKSNIKHTKNVLFIWPVPDDFSCQAIRLIEQRSNGCRMLLLRH